MVGLVKASPCKDQTSRRALSYWHHRIHPYYADKPSTPLNGTYNASVNLNAEEGGGFSFMLQRTVVARMHCASVKRLMRARA